MLLWVLNVKVLPLQRRRFDYDELVDIAGNSTVLIIDSVKDLDNPEVVEQLMPLLCCAVETD